MSLSKLRACACVVVILCVASISGAPAPVALVAACKGDASCHVCKNCSRCAWCKSHAQKCGVYNRGATTAPTTLPTTRELIHCCE